MRVKTHKRTILKYEDIIDMMDLLHKNELYELEGWISLGLDTGFRSVDFERLTREDIIDSEIREFYCIRLGDTYPDVTLSDRSLSLLEHLPSKGVLFPKRQYIYLQKVRECAKKRFIWHDLRKVYLKRKYDLGEAEMPLEGELIWKK